MSAPVSLSQEERLHFGRHVHCNNNNVVLAYQITGPLHPDLLVQAVETVTLRHESLRLSFTADCRLRIADCGAGTEHVMVDSLEQAIHVVTAHWGRRYDLTNGPLLRSTLVQITPEWHVLALLLDHSIIDGWSLSQVSDELLRIYDALANGRELRLPDSPRFSDFVVKQREMTQGEVLDRALQYWERQLAGMGPIPPSGLTDVGKQDTSDVDIARVVLDPLLVGELARFTKAANISAVPVYLAAIGAAIRRHQTDVTPVGLLTMVANRTDPATDRLVGYLTNRVPIRLGLDDEPPLTELVTRANKALWGAMRHQRVPHSVVVRNLAPELYGSLGTTPDTIPPHVFFNIYPDRTGTLPEPAGLTVTQLAIPTPRVPRGGLDIAVLPSRGGVSLQVKYLTRRYSPDWIQSFVDDLQRHLARVLLW